VPSSRVLVHLINVNYRHDSKDVFREGLIDIQIKLEERYYTSVQAFSEDMAAVFSSVIGFTTITNVTDAEHQLSEVAHSSLTGEQKEKKKLAKRIIKSIQPLFDDALRKESDLAGRPFEREVPNLETLLDQKLQTRQPPSTSGDGVQQSIEADMVTGEQLNGTINGTMPLGNGLIKGNDNMHLAPTPEDNGDDPHAAQDDSAVEAAIAAQLGQDTAHAHKSNMDADAMDIDQMRPDDVHTAPPTPPGSDQDLLGPIHHGGIPWYMKEFDPEGTTVYEEQWTGPQVLRDMSEELSELDDEELNGLADPEAMMLGDGGGPETVVSEAAHKAARNKRRRNRGAR